MLSPFLACLTEQLTKRGYGDKRQAELVDRFQGLTAHYTAEGAIDPEALAMARTLQEVTEATARKARMNYTALKKVADIKTHFDTFDYNNAIFGKTNEKASEADAAVALLSMDARSKSNLNTERFAELYKGQLWRAGNDIVQKLGKGKFGYQRGKAYFDNFVDEVFGKSTSDNVASDLAKSWNKMTEMVVDLWRHAGGEMERLQNWGLPQLQSLAKLIKNGGANGGQWISDHMGWVDWDRMRWPNGAPIEAAERQGVLEAVWHTLSSDGTNKIDPKSFKGNGHALGDAVDQHRFLIYKDGEAWRQQHEKYGDGTVFDVMTSYIADITHKMGLIRVFGNNPPAMAETVKALALKAAGNESGRAKQIASAVLKNKFDPLMETALRRNAMDPESTGANIVLGVGNILNSAQLAGAVLAAMPGDFATTMITRAFNHLPVLDGLTGYMRNLVNPAQMDRLATQSGFVLDELVHSIYSKSRFSGVAEYGPAWTKKVSDFTMRASGMNIHTNGLRWVNQAEMMGALASEAGNAFDKVPFKDMMAKYNIGEAEWNAMRKLDQWEPYAGVKRLRPSDILDTKLANRQDLYEKFQSMILQESRYMVPNSTTEASVMLKGTTRPDTLPGALLHSFAMYKNFPMTMALMYGRVAMSIPNQGGRIGMVAALGSSMLLAGAVGIQLREMSKGRDPLPVNAPAFWGKAALASGAMSIWGDFLFYGVNDYGKSPTDIAAGPIVQWGGDTAQLAFGHMFDFADKMGTLKADKNDKKAPWLANATEYASRYAPGSSLWYARLALQRELFDPLRAISDPRGAQKMQKREMQREKDFGNGSWWGPNTSKGFMGSVPERLPALPEGRR